MKNTLDALNNRLDEAENPITDLKDKVVEKKNTIWKRKKKGWKNKDSLRDLWDNIKPTNIWIIGVPEGEEREKATKIPFTEIMAENFPILVKETGIQF